MSGPVELVADCRGCVGLCCVVPAFAASADFALDKPAGVPCPHLGEDFLCTIHDALPERGFGGCVVYDCFGAGQRVVARHADPDWRDAGVRGPLFAEFERVERLHELLWYAADALARCPDARLRAEVEGLAAQVETAAAGAGDEADVLRLQRRADPLLAEVSAAVRGSGGADLRGLDLVGADLRGEDLTGATLRGALALGADLRDQDLTDADVLGADLRGADLRGADLGSALFLTRLQVRAARTDSRTRTPWSD